jgi:hypothetical protein
MRLLLLDTFIYELVRLYYVMKGGGEEEEEEEEEITRDYGIRSARGEKVRTRDPRKI